MNDKRRRAVIVGAGIAGPIVALWLERFGWDVVLTEARATVSAEGAFLGVAPNGLNALRGLGLATRVIERGHPCAGFQFANRTGRIIGTIDRSEDRRSYGFPLTMIRRSDLHELLAQSFPARFGLSLTHVDRRADGVTARFADGTAIDADILIGCDGLRSTTRALCLPDASVPTFAGLLDFGGFTRVKSLPFSAGVNVMVFGARAFFGAFLTPVGETWWFHNGAPTDEKLSTEQHRERMIELHRDDPAWVSELIRSTPEVLGPWRIHELDKMPRWSSGRVCLLGDAAHAMSPSAGQGASLAMEDALVLAQCLRDIDDPARAFTRFEALRRPRVDAIFKAAKRNSNNKALGPIAAWFRDRLLPRFMPAAGRAQSESYAFTIDIEQRISGT